jgi:hypothetical protein
MNARNAVHPLWQGYSDSRLFEYLKKSEFMAEVRQYFESLYDSLESKNLLDKHFNDDFRNQVPQRWWELFVGNWLLNQPTVTALSAYSNGPDFKIELDGKSCWIECVAPWPKNKNECINRQLPAQSVAHLNSSDFVLSITDSVAKKSAKFANYLSNKIVGMNDTHIIALSMTTSRNIDILEANDTPILFQSLLGLGQRAIRVPVGSDSVTIPFELVQTHRFEIPKKSNAPVQTNSFLTGIHKNVSGILYSIHRYVDCPNPQTTDLLLLHNPTAANPLPRGSLALVKEYFVENDQLVLLSKPEHGGGVLNE